MNIIQNTWKTAGQGVNVDWLSPKVAQRVMAFHCQVPGYAPTPLKSLPELAEKCGAEIVQVIGSRFILFKRNPKKPIYEM